MPNSLMINNLTFRWSKNNDFNLSIPKWQIKTGQKVFLYGRSGEGKSTLLNLVAGIETRYAGNIQVLGQNLAALNQRQKDKFRANNIGIIFQQFNLLPYLSAEQNINLSQCFKRQPTKQSKETLKAICDQLELNQTLLSKKAQLLSVGQQQRVAVARALYGAPSFIIADEPTSALDSESRDKFIRLLLESTKDTTVLFVSHDMSLASHFDQCQSMENLQVGALDNVV